MALKPAKTTRLQGKSSFRMGAPPVFGKPLITGVPGPDPSGVAVDAVRVPVGVDVATGGAAQTGPVMVFWFSVTAACARTRPFKLAPACISMLVPASMLP